MGSAPILPGICALCQAREKLERSHIMPRFVYRAVAAEGIDGPPSRLLCGDCEDRFSVWESHFARDIFHPRIASRARPVKYGPWLLKFAASVCWRVLEHARRNDQLGSLQKRWSGEWGDSLEVWRDFLRERRSDVGAHQLYLSGWSGGCSGEHRAPAFEIVSGDDEARVNVQLGPLALVGLIGGRRTKQNDELRLNLEGKLKCRVERAFAPALR